MSRVLYIVARKRPLLCGYLMATVDARTPDGHLVEIKLDERRSERRRQREAPEPERRRGERRHRPNYAADFRCRGYATVVQPEALPSVSGRSSREPAMVWRTRSPWWHRAARARWRSHVRWPHWGLIAVLLTVVGAGIVVGRSLHQPANPSRRGVASSPPESARQTGDTPPRAPASTASPRSPAGRPVAPSNPPAGHIVTTRSSGIVMTVSPGARTLVLQDMGAAAGAGRLRVEVAPDARVVLSERDDRAEDLSHPFKDTVISLSDVRPGDFVVVEMKRAEGTAVARSVVVTFRRTTRKPSQ